MCGLFNFARNEERRKKTNKVRSERAKPAENGSKRGESKEKKRKPCTFLFYSKPAVKSKNKMQAKPKQETN